MSVADARKRAVRVLLTRIYPVVYYDWYCSPWIYDQATRNIIAVAIRLK